MRPGLMGKGQRVLRVMLLAVSLAAASGVQAQEILYKTFHNGTEGVADWINEDCGPREAAAVRGYVDHAMIYRGTRRHPVPHLYTVHVWCRADRARTTWKRVSGPRSRTGALPMTDLIRSNRLVFIGNRAADPRLAQVVLLRR
jgi:hypothetical protein